MRQKASTADYLKAGAAMLEITPKTGTHLGGSGMGVHRPARSVLDPLYVKALALENKEKRAVIVAFDLVIVADDWANRVRQTAAERFGLDPSGIIVHAIQTHSAPGLGHFMLDPDFPVNLPPEKEYLRGGETSYYAFAAERAVEAIGNALSSLRPVQTGYGRAVCHNLAFNRRAVNRDGLVEMPWPHGRRRQPLGPTNLLYMEGPIDPEVGVMCLRDDDMNMVAVLLSYTCHPVNVFSWESSFYAVSADWPGAWSAGTQEIFHNKDGTSCVPIVLNGCCGNINPWDPFDPDFLPDHRRMGAKLAETEREIIASINFDNPGIIDSCSRRIPLDYREIPPERLAEVENILSNNPDPVYQKDNPGQVSWEWFSAASTQSILYCKKRMPEFLYEIQVLRMGNAAFVALPGEPFVEGQLAIKLGSPAPFTQVIHMTSQYVGYIPTRDAYLRFGHEANKECTYWAKLAPGSLEKIVETAIMMVGDIFKK